jgi:enoyl-CoA hydratase
MTGIDVEPGGDGVTVVRMRHGKVNALDLELLLALRETFDGLRDSAVVLTGDGRVFSAGVDLRRLLDGGADYARKFLPALQGACRAVFTHPRPVVAAVNGHAIAGGCVLVCACDRRYMGSGTIGVSELLVGVPFPTVPMEVLRWATGTAAPGLALTGRAVPAAEAVGLGLVDEQVADDRLLGAAVAEARRLARLPRASFALTKEQLRRDALARMAADGERDRERLLAIWTSPEVAAAVRTFMDGLGRGAGAR